MIPFSQVAEPIWVRIKSAFMGVMPHQPSIHKAVTHNFSGIQLC